MAVVGEGSSGRGSATATVGLLRMRAAMLDDAVLRIGVSSEADADDEAFLETTLPEEDLVSLVRQQEEGEGVVFS